MAKPIVILPGGVRFAVAPRRWLAGALCALGVVLIWSFVVVLQQGVERGDKLRAEQRRTATQPPVTKPQRSSAVKTVKTVQAEPPRP